MASRVDRNVRPLVGLVVLMVVLAGVMVWQKTYSPKLGLDLRGGTTITLTARNSTGAGQVSQTSLQQAVEIIQNRVDSLGVGESEVTTQGNNQIIVSVPNVQQDELVRLVGTTAKLNFRIVYGAQTVTPTADASPSGMAPSGEPTSGSTNLPSAGSATPSGNNRPLPGLPPPPPSPTPTASASATPSATGTPSLPPGVPEDKALSWQPTDADYVAFQNYQCGQPVTEIPDQPLVTCNRDHTEKLLLGPTLIDGDKLTGAQAGIPQNQVAWAVDLQFNSVGTQQFADVTSYLAQQQQGQNRFGIVLDGQVVSAPTVSYEIANGQAQITGNFTSATAQELANVLKYGALPLAFDISSVDNVSAVLGGEQLRAGIIAGIIGLLLVVLFALAYYRGLGIVVVISLAAAAVLTYEIMCLLGGAVGFALNLPGIAGAIVAIGITADSFIIYFERIRDEVRDGRGLRSAVQSGWMRARQTIVVADSVSLLSAVVLFILAIGSVKGFAFTLGLTTAIDLLVVFFFTRPFVNLLARTRFYGGGHRLSGLDPGHLGVSALPGTVRRGSRATTKETITDADREAERAAARAARKEARRAARLAEAADGEPDDELLADDELPADDEAVGDEVDDEARSEADGELLAADEAAGDEGSDLDDDVAGAEPEADADEPVVDEADADEADEAGADEASADEAGADETDEADTEEVAESESDDGDTTDAGLSQRRAAARRSGRAAGRKGRHR